MLFLTRLDLKKGGGVSTAYLIRNYQILYYSDTSAATSRDLNADVDDDEIQIIETISSPPLPSASR